MALLSAFGKRHKELLSVWVPSAVIYGGSLVAGLVYLTDWKVIATKIPIYNTKFSDEEK